MKVFWRIHSVEYIRTHSSREFSKAGDQIAEQSVSTHQGPNLLKQAYRRRAKLIEEATLRRIESENPRGLASAQILGLFREHDVTFSEATLRKYVQLGLLPRSVRVGEKGKHRGSRGLYPVSVVRRILLIKTLMAERHTIEQIQSEFLFLAVEIDQLEVSLRQVLDKITESLRGLSVPHEGIGSIAERDARDAQRLGRALLERLRGLEFSLRSQRGRARPGDELPAVG